MWGGNIGDRFSKGRLYDFLMQVKKWSLFVRQLGVCSTFLSVAQGRNVSLYKDSIVELDNNDTDCF